MKLSGPPARMCSVCDRQISIWVYQTQEDCDAYNKYLSKQLDEVRNTFPEIKPEWIEYFDCMGCTRYECPKMAGSYNNDPPLPEPA